MGTAHWQAAPSCKPWMAQPNPDTDWKDTTMKPHSLPIAGDCCHSQPSTATPTLPRQMAERVTDPVCGMQVDPTSTPEHATATHAGQTYYFCCGSCATRFRESPERYLGGSAARQEPVPPGAIWTCPMHP